MPFEEIKSSRRRFFGLLAATPIAAKEAADNAVASLAGIKPNGVGTVYPRIHNFGAPAPGASYEAGLISASRYVKMFGIPTFYESELRERAKNFDSLDPDIANKRSWSFAVKVQEQRQRNYERERRRIANHGAYAMAESAFEKATGFRWPWS